MAKSKGAKKHPKTPHDVVAIRRELAKFLRQKDDDDHVIGGATCGVYVFYDYDGEPIYVGKTYEKLRGRISRHLTNRRTDAVAMNVLDPFEVADVEIYPFFDLEKRPGESAETWKGRVKPVLARVEWTVYKKVRDASRFKAVLNEKVVPETKTIKLPLSYKGRIIPSDMFELRSHPDIRIARRATTIAALARIISERVVQLGLRQTLDTQAKRLQYLVGQRLGNFSEAEMAEEATEEDTGENVE
ncbi:MAG: GIY-YIG nuclease family protein [Vicinamibacterales bacterium]